MNTKSQKDSILNNQQSHLAEHDYLTNLANRRGLYDYYASLDKNDVIHAMYIDVDNFKRINDTYGHNMGDDLLICISKLIRFYTKGFASRIGGDEYVVLFNGAIDIKDMKEIAQNLISNMENMDFRKDILSLISLSIGIVFKQSASQPLDDILAKCDSAMYQAKHSGKNRYSIYSTHDKSLELAKHIELEMEDALVKDEFKVYFQPKMNMVSSQLCGAEALSRWVHAKDNVRTPDIYVPIFEKNGFISKLDMYMFEEVCRIKASWAGKKYAHIPVSINMSRLHLYNRQLPDTLADIAAKYNIPTNELELEITENTFIMDNVELVKMIDKLQAKGFLVSIDDFGSGLSALNLIKDLEVDTIKIDREFLKLSFNDPRGKKVLRSIISMCKDLKMEVVTEGIETKEQIQFITRCGCRIAQGFYYSDPIPVKEFEKYADTHILDDRKNYVFHLNGNLTSEDGDLEGTTFGNGFRYEDGIFSDTKSLHFPGGEMGQNVVRIPASAIINESYTISLWIKPQKMHLWTAAFYIGFEKGFCGIIPLAWEGHSDFRIHDYREVNGWYDISGCQLQKDVWSHFVVTYNATTETATAFINGDVVDILENVPVNHFATEIMLGGDVFQPSFTGNICDLIIYNETKDYDFVRELHDSYRYDEKFIGFFVPSDIEANTR